MNLAVTISWSILRTRIGMSWCMPQTHTRVAFHKMRSHLGNNLRKERKHRQNLMTKSLSIFLKEWKNRSICFDETECVEADKEGIRIHKGRRKERKKERKKKRKKERHWFVVVYKGFRPASGPFYISDHALNSLSPPPPTDSLYLSLSLTHTHTHKKTAQRGH